MLSSSSVRRAAILLLLSACHTCTARAEEQPLERITFGSCAKQDKPQPIWDAVVALRPERFLFIGDNIYGDSADMNVLRTKYALLGAQPGFQKLRQTCPVLATWDDHDFGVNDGGSWYPKKVESQRIMLDFFGVPADSPRRAREGEQDAQDRQREFPNEAEMRCNFHDAIPQLRERGRATSPAS